jgi:hypothetical protein
MYMQVEGNAAVETYFGMIMYTGVPQDTLVPTFESQVGTELTTESYGGRTIYVGTNTTEMTTQETVVAPLSDGKVVVGTRPAAEDAIDVVTGSGNALGGSLRSQYQSLGSGYLRFASMVPEEQLPSGGGSGGSSGQINGLDDLTAVSGRFYTSGSNVGMDVNMHTAGSQSASDLAQSIGGLIQFQAAQSENDDIREVLNAIDTSASGTTATVAYQQSVSKLQTYVENYANALVGGMGGTVGVGAGGGVGSS